MRKNYKPFQRKNIYLTRGLEYYSILLTCIVLTSLAGILFYRQFGQLEGMIVLCAMIGAGALLAFSFLGSLEWIIIDEKGITLYSLFHRKIDLPWEKVCCSGYFYHKNHPLCGKPRKYLYFSRKPLTNHLQKTWETVLPKLSADFVFVAKQGNVEEKIAGLFGLIRDGSR